MNNIGEQINFLNHLEQNPYKLYKATFYDEALKQNMTYIGFKGNPCKNPPELEGKQIMMGHISKPEDPEFLKQRIYQMKDEYMKWTMGDGKDIDWDSLNEYINK